MDSKAGVSLEDLSVGNYYTCTFTECDESFKDSDTWKRHENRNHHSQKGECWHCSACQVVTFTREKFAEHLEKHAFSGFAEKYIDDRHINADFQENFYCGFCQDIIFTNQDGDAAYVARFEHIENHFIQEELTKKQWVNLYAHQE